MTLLVLALAWDTVRREQDDPSRAAVRSVPWLLAALVCDQLLALSSVVTFWGEQPDLGDRWQTSLLGGGSALVTSAALLAAGSRVRNAEPSDPRWELLAGLGALSLLGGGVTVWLAW